MLKKNPIFFKNVLYALLHQAGVDRAVLLGIATKSWNMLAGVISLLLIANNFSPQLQGYYYTFFSIISFQFVVELGLGTVIIQFASHEWSGLFLDDEGRIGGEGEALSRLQSLAQIFFRWYCIASIVLTLGLGVGGFLFFLNSPTAGINWMLPWFSLCVCNGLIFCLLPIWSLLEGCNQIMKLYSYRLVQSIVLSVSLWVAILLGAKLWSATISNIAVLTCAGFFLVYKCRNFLKTLLLSPPAGAVIDWYQEILPLQWRISLTWLIAPFAYNLFVPVLFKYYGPVIAGQMGMTLNVIIAVLAIPSSWLSPRIPQFGMLVAQKNYDGLDRLFWRTTKNFTAIAITGAVMAWLAVCALNWMKHPLALRFLPILPTGIFILAQAVLVLAVPFSTYLRVHKKEPLLWVSIAGGVSIGVSTLILGKYYSALGMAVGNLIINMVIAPLVFIIWHRCREEWHLGKCAIEAAPGDI